MPTEPVITTPINVLNDTKQNISELKRGLEMDVARLKARQNAIESRIAIISDQTVLKLQNDSITAELEKLVANQTVRLELLKKENEAQVKSGLAPKGTPDTIIEAEEKLARTKIELAKRREELGKEAGGDQLTTLNKELSYAILDLAEKKAEFQIIEKQFSEIDSQIKSFSTRKTYLAR